MDPTPGFNAGRDDDVLEKLRGPFERLNRELSDLVDREGSDSPKAIDKINEHVGKYMPLYTLAAINSVGDSLRGSAAGRTGPADPSQRVSRHLRAYLPLYALGTIWALMLILVPTVNQREGAQTAGGSLGSGGSAVSAGVSAEEAGAQALDASVPAAGSSGTARGPATHATSRTGVGTPSTKPGIGRVVADSGVTRGGFDCKPGVRQIPLSQYASGCVAKFEGDNGGATYRGVTKDTIKFSIRVQADAGGPNAQTVDEVNRAAGRADRTGAVNILRRYSDYFNKTFELYGRKVVFEQVTGNGVGTDEAQSKGRETACADATDLVSKGYFGDVLFAVSLWESEPFSWCAAEKKLFLPLGAPYFPENFYRKWHPYVWGTQFMECEQIGRDMAEYIGKRLAFRKAKWAGDPLIAAQERKFAIYVPDNDGYQQCINIEEKQLNEKYGVKPVSRWNYQLDVSRFPDQAAQGIIQFKAAGATTIQQSCDTISTQLLTQAAKAQNYYPEWWIIGVASQDLDGSARQFEQQEVNGHLFGMSQFGAESKINSKESEPYKVWKLAYPGEEPPQGYGPLYFNVLHIFNLLQAAGPVLTPDNIAKGMASFPLSGASGAPMGTWDFSYHHTGVSDAREVFWDGSVTGYDGKAGAYIETYGGRRFRSGEWAAEEPPIPVKK